MTSTIAFIGKSGCGKSTLARSFVELLKQNFASSSILIVDNDLTLELSETFGIKTKNTIYGIKSGKHEYKTGIPQGMTKQEYIDWALEDIIVQVDENVDLIVTGFVTPKDCNCPANRLTSDSVSKLIDRYDFAVIDCEYDLKYLNHLTDYMIDVAVIVTLEDKDSIEIAKKIEESSHKYITNGQIGVILNKAQSENVNESLNIINALELNLFGCVKKYDKINYKELKDVLEVFYSRMNLPQKDG